MLKDRVFRIADIYIPVGAAAPSILLPSRRLPRAC